MPFIIHKFKKETNGSVTVPLNGIVDIINCADNSVLFSIPFVNGIPTGSNIMSYVGSYSLTIDGTTPYVLAGSISIVITITTGFNGAGGFTIGNDANSQALSSGYNGITELANVGITACLAVNDHITLNNAFADNTTLTGSCIIPAISQQPANATINTGQTLTLTVIASTANEYQWYQDGVLIVGAISATYSKSNAQLSDAGDYYCVVKNNCGAGQSTSTLQTNTVSAVINGICQNVTATISTMTDAIVGQAYTHYISIFGTAPFTINPYLIPAGLSASVVQINSDWFIKIDGTPTTSGTNIPFEIDVFNCAGAGGVNIQNTLTINPANPNSCDVPTVATPLSPLVGTVGVAYSGSFTVANCTGVVVMGLPSGLSAVLSGSTVTITGTPATSGTVAITANLTNSCGGGLTTSTANGVALGSLTISPASPNSWIPPAIVNINACTHTAIIAVDASIPDLTIIGLWKEQNTTTTPNYYGLVESGQAIIKDSLIVSGTYYAKLKLCHDGVWSEKSVVFIVCACTTCGQPVIDTPLVSGQTKLTGFIPNTTSPIVVSLDNTNFATTDQFGAFRIDLDTPLVACAEIKVSVNCGANLTYSQIVKVGKFEACDNCETCC